MSQPSQTPFIDAVLAYRTARRRVMNAQTRTQFLKASADLWQAEHDLDVLASQVEREREVETT